MSSRIGYGTPGIVTDNLVLHLDAANIRSYVSGSTNWNDLSGCNNNGVLINGPTYSTSNAGFINCDGTNDYVMVNNSNSLIFGSENFTIEYWVRKLRSTAGFNDIWGVNKWNSGTLSNVNEFSLVIGNDTDGNADSFKLAISCNNIFYGSDYIPSKTIPINKWCQIIGIRSGGTIQTYLNTVLVSSVSPSGFTSSSVMDNTGQNLYICGSASNQFNSKADSSVVRIYKGKVLSQAEITQNYNALKLRYGL